MPPIDLTGQAAAVRAVLPNADVRTDQCDILRVYHAKLLGAVRPVPDGAFEWSVIDLDSEGDIPCVTGPPIVGGIASSGIDAARAMATELDRLGGPSKGST